MEQHEIELGIRVGNRHIRDIQETALNDLAKDLRVKGRVLTYDDMNALKQVQIAGNILTERINRFYNHFADGVEVVPVIDEESDDEFI